MKHDGIEYEIVDAIGTTRNVCEGCAFEDVECEGLPSCEDGVFVKSKLTLQQLQDKHEVDSIPELIYDSYINGNHKQTLSHLHEVAELSDYDVDDVLNGIECSPEDMLYFKNKYFNLTLKETM